MRERNSYGSVFFLQIFIALFFALSGLLYLTGYNTAGSQFIRGVGKLFGKNDLWRVIIALIQLFSGLILFVGTFIRSNQKSLFFASLTITILWIVNIVMQYFMETFLHPSLMIWLRDLSMQMIILSGLWAITRQYQ